MPGFFTIDGSQAGLHLAAKIDAEQSDIKLAEQLEQIGIISRSLSHYYIPQTRTTHKINGLVLGFACATPRQIVAATRRMATTLGLIA
jgi:DNA-binding transcriptional MocR family regulator